MTHHLLQANRPALIVQSVGVYRAAVIMRLSGIPLEQALAALTKVKR